VSRTPGGRRSLTLYSWSRLHSAKLESLRGGPPHIQLERRGVAWEYRRLAEHLAFDAAGKEPNAS
jgi:hypothetical protein